MATIVFASDSHLNKHYARMTPDQLSERRARLRAGLQQTIDYAIAQRADVYIHGGDLFDTPNPRAVELVWAAGHFQRLADAGIQTIMIGGNHDIPKTRLGGATPQRLFETMRAARVFTRPTAVEWWTGEVGGVRLAIGGLPPDPRLTPKDDPFALLDEPIEPPEADIRLLVTHYALEGRLHPLAEEATITKSSIAALKGTIDAVLIGHIHEAVELTIDDVKVVFPGPTERLSFGEMDVRCGFARLDVDPATKALSIKQIHLDPQPMRRETVRVTDVDPEDPTGWITERVRAVSAPDQILQFRLEGPLGREAYQRLRSRDISQLGNELNFYFDLDRKRLTVHDETEVAAARAGSERISPRAEIAMVADLMIAETEEEETRSIIAEARAMLLDRYGSGGLDDDERGEETPPAEARSERVQSESVQSETTPQENATEQVAMALDDSEPESDR